MPDLFLIRHAKAESAGETDQSRALSAIGKEQCHQLQLQFAKPLARLDSVVVSPAVRTQQTWQLVSEGLTVPATLTEPLVYEATPGTLLTVVQNLSGERACLVGHNPGIARLSTILVNALSPSEQTQLAAMGTGCLVWLRSDEPFKDWSPGCATLVEFFRPAVAD